MKKKWISAFLFLCAALLTVGFVVRLYCDYVFYYAYGSAPFYLYIAKRFICYLIPAIGCFAAAIILQKRKTEAS